MNLPILERYLGTRPRALNFLHRMRLAEAVSQTNEIERAALAKSAAGARTAVEIGSFQGVSSTIIASSMHPAGTLYCVDPWLESGGKKDPSRAIFERHTRRMKVTGRIKVLRGRASAVRKQIPPDVDFMFVDGDHGLAGISADWAIVKEKLKRGGFACFHDVVIPEREPWRVFDSVRFFQEEIAKDSDFRIVDTVYSMAILERK